MTEKIRIDCDLEDYNPYNYEYHIMFQASENRYYMTCLDGCYAFENDEFVTINHKKVIMGGKEYDSPGTINLETLKRFERALTHILRKATERNLRYVCFMMIMPPEWDEAEPNINLLYNYVRDAYFDAGCKDIRLDIYNTRTGSCWHKRQTAKHINRWQEIKKRKNYMIEEVSEEAAEESIRDIIGATDKFKDPQAEFVEIINLFIENRAREDINRGRLKVYNGNVDAAVTRWKSQFTKDFQANTDQRDKVYRLLKGENLKKNKNLLLLLCYELRMTAFETQVVLKLAGLQFDADNKQESILLYLIDNEIYKYKQRELDEALDELGITDIYELAKFTDEEE